jgi:hypothetical protein
MNDVPLVRGIKRLGDLPRDRQRVADRNCPAPDPLCQVFTFDQFHHQRGATSTLFEAMDVGDVRVVQRREELCFPLETRKALGIIGERIRQNLDCHIAFQLSVPRTPHFAHAAHADLGGDFVRAEARTGSQ